MEKTSRREYNFVVFITNLTASWIHWNPLVHYSGMYATFFLSKICTIQWYFFRLICDGTFAIFCFFTAGHQTALWGNTIGHLWILSAICRSPTPKNITDHYIPLNIKLDYNEIQYTSENFQISLQIKVHSRFHCSQ